MLTLTSRGFAEPNDPCYSCMLSKERLVESDLSSEDVNLLRVIN